MDAIHQNSVDKLLDKDEELVLETNSQRMESLTGRAEDAYWRVISASSAQQEEMQE